MNKLLHMKRNRTTVLPPYLMDEQGTLLEDFEVIGDWTTSGTVEQNTTNYLTGAKSLKFTATTGAVARADRSITPITIDEFYRLSAGQSVRARVSR